MSWRSAVAALALVCAYVTGVRSAAAEEPAPPRVVEVFGATSDTYDVAGLGDRVLIATSGGLVIDRAGRLERVLTSLDGLPGTRARSVSVTAEGAWVGLVDGAALVRIDDKGDARVSRTLALGRVRRAVAWQGDTWLGAYGGGLFRMGSSGEPRAVPLDKGAVAKQVTDLVVHDGALYVATAGAGVLQLGRDGKVARRFRAKDGLADDLVWDLEAAGDRVVVATAGGVTVLRDGRVDRAAREAVASRSLGVADVRGVARSGDTLWLATFGGGVHALAAGDKKPRRVPTLDAGLRARAAVHTAEGVVVAHDAGAARIRPDGTASAIVSGGMPSSDVTALARGLGALWIGTFDRGLARAGGERMDAITTVPGVDRRINDLAVTREDGRETLWIATDRGLYRSDGKTSVRVTDEGAPTSEHVTALHVDPASGDLWCAGSQSVGRRRRGTWSSWRATGDMPLSQLGAVTTDTEGRAWIGGLHGLFRLEPDSGKLQRFGAASGDLPVDWVTAVIPYKGGIAAGTYHGGVVFGGGSGSFRTVRERDGLPAGWVNPHAMATLGGELWFGSLDRGLVIGHRGAWSRLGLAEALPSADVTDVLDAGSRDAWIATRGGLARVRR